MIQRTMELGKALDAGINVSLIDVAHPYRRAMGGAAQQHGNLVVLGTETWGDVRGLSTKAKVTADEAMRSRSRCSGARSDEAPR